MAHDRTGAIAAAVKKQQNARGITARSDRPLRRQTIYINRSQLHIIGRRPHGANFIETLSTFKPTDRARL
jgi:hypothetical protein